jgi:hypothetical protein
MTWESALGTASKLLDAQRRRVAVSTPAEADAIIAAAGITLAAESPDVAALLRAQSADNLANRLAVASDVFAAFARTPNRNEIRLVNVIDDHLRLLILDLRPLVARTGPQQGAATDVLPTSAVAAALFVLALTDARLRFGLRESIAPVLDGAREDAGRILAALRAVSDARFRIETLDTGEGLLELGFTFNGNFNPVVVPVVPGRITEAQLQRVREAMRPKQNIQFATFPRVPELNTYVDRLSAVVSFGDEAPGDTLLPGAVPQAVPLRMPIAQA